MRQQPDQLLNLKHGTHKEGKKSLVMRMMTQKKNILVSGPWARII
jgi:hypothetical protein